MDKFLKYIEEEKIISEEYLDIAPLNNLEKIEVNGRIKGLEEIINYINEHNISDINEIKGYIIILKSQIYSEVFDMNIAKSNESIGVKEAYDYALDYINNI